MEKKIRSINLYVSVVSFLSPPERAKSSLSAVSKTFRTACNWPALVRWDVKSAETVMMAEAKTAPDGFCLNEHTFQYENASVNGVTTPGYIAYYWLIFKRHHDLPLSKLMQPLTRLPLDFWMDADTVQQVNIIKANGYDTHDGMGYLTDATERLRRATIFRQLADLFHGTRKDGNAESLCFTCEPSRANLKWIRLCRVCKTNMEAGKMADEIFMSLVRVSRVAIADDDKQCLPYIRSIETLEQILVFFYRCFTVYNRRKPMEIV
jgi:hypothetical protein